MNRNTNPGSVGGIEKVTDARLSNTRVEEMVDEVGCEVKVATVIADLDVTSANQKTI